MKSKGKEKIRDIAFRKAQHMWDGKGYACNLTPAEFKCLAQHGAVNLAGDFWTDYCIKNGISRKGIYWWKWTKKFNEAYWKWRIPRLGKGG